jgi:hypothetical protein
VLFVIFISLIRFIETFSYSVESVPSLVFELWDYKRLSFAFWEADCFAPLDVDQSALVHLDY